MQSLGRDLRYAWRVLGRQPSFVGGAVLTLALSIGASTAIFSVVDAVLLRPLPFPAPERLAWVFSVRPERSDAPFSLPEFLDYRRTTRTFEDLAAVANWSATLTGRGDAERLQGLRISAHA